MIAHGDRVRVFEQAVANYLGATGGVACTSGTTALSLALKTLGIGAGDEVVLPSYVCWNVLSAVAASGATPRLCDVDDSGVATVQTVRAVLSPQTRAIVAVHIFGHPCGIDSISSLGLPVIEDACQAFGLEISGRLAGTLGDLGVLSFHATKCMTTGEGGMLVTSNARLLDCARSLVESVEQKNTAGAASMSDLQAALGLAQLERYPTFLDRRQQLFASYHQTACQLVTAFPGYLGKPPFLFRYTLRAQYGFESAQTALLAQGVQARRGVDELLHRRLGLDDHDYPGATKLFSQVVSLPFYPSLTEQEHAQVLRAIREVFYVA
ncbi:MAG: aminotransferase class I/II-fold pyridoxal phosphate-dependent enzyme [Magnetococcus sp. THC-1_WYH]